MEMTDIVIIGAGPAGLSAAINGLARGKSVRILSNENNYLEKTEQINNYLGFNQVSGQEMMDQFKSHVKAMGVEIEIGKVTNILALDIGFVLSFGNDIVSAKTVIISIGLAKAKEVTGEAALLGNGVSYCATCDGMLYRGKNVVVYGLADNSVEEANFLQGIAAKVTFVSPANRSEHLHTEVDYIRGTLQEIIGETRTSEVVIKTSGMDKESKEAELIKLQVDGVFLLRNMIAPSSLVPNLDTAKGFIRVNQNMETNIQGLYACGDCVGGSLQVANAVGEGLIAAVQAAKYIDKKNKQ